jgi:tetraacyldisaccharide 4'-kinase
VNPQAVLASSMQRRGALALLLLPLSWLFGAVAALRRALYRGGWLRQERVSVPVVIVGNISVGGSGKTPLVLWLAARLRERGFNPGIVSRGYGGSATVPRAVGREDPADLVGDEPLLLARRSGCPVWIGRERAAAARGLLAAHPECDVLIADDGLQHYALARDFEIVVMDRRGVGNGWRLPAGPLREGPRRLDSVDALVVNGAHLPDAARRVPPPRRFTMTLAGERFLRLAAPHETCTADDLRGRKLHALAGIGEPQRFFDHLSALGLDFSAHPFPDHHRYTARDLASAAGGTLLMTEKDGVKCAGLSAPDTWVLRVDATVAADPAAAGHPDLVDLVAEKIDGPPPA